jgi:hypothetical protein
LMLADQPLLSRNWIKFDEFFAEGPTIVKRVRWS